MSKENKPGFVPKLEGWLTVKTKDIDLPKLREKSYETIVSLAFGSWRDEIKQYIKDHGFLKLTEFSKFTTAFSPARAEKVKETLAALRHFENDQLARWKH